MIESEQENGDASVAQSPVTKREKDGTGYISELTAPASTTSLDCSSESELEEESCPQQLDAPQNEAETTENEEEKVEKRRRRHRNRKILIGLCLLAIVIFVIVDSTTTMYCRTAINSLLKWVEENPVVGIFAFTLFVFVATVAFIPGAILTLGAGFVFERAWGLGPGILVGTLTVFIGASAGAIVSFLIGRYLLRDCVDRLAHRYTIFEALDAVMKDKGLGFRIMALLRLSPIIPFNAINYISGVTSISLLSYSLANIAILPGTALFCLVGASAACIANNMGAGQTVTIIVIVVGVVFAVFAVFFASFYARRELNRIIALRESQDEGEMPTESDIEQGLNDDASQESSEVELAT